MKKILVIDDDANICKALQVMIKSLGYEVGTARDGISGIEAVSSFTPDLVVCDLMMPNMDGYQFIQEIRTNPGTASLPIILLTAKGEDKDILEGYKTGADYYLTKPFTRDQLIYGIQLMIEGDKA